MSLVKEFKDFVARGNVVDMAVGVVIGTAFGKIVSSLVTDVIMPPIGKITGNINFSDLFVGLEPDKMAGITSLAQAKEKGVAVIAYGQFISTMVDFVVVAACIFLMVKVINRMKSAPNRAAEALNRPCPHCLQSIPAKAKKCAFCTSNLEPVS